MIKYELRLQIVKFIELNLISCYSLTIVINNKIIFWLVKVVSIVLLFKNMLIAFIDLIVLLVIAILLYPILELLLMLVISFFFKICIVE